QLVTIGLSVIEHVGDLEGDYARTLAAVFLGHLAHDRGEDPDRRFAASDLAPQLPPALVPGHVGGVRTLPRDEQLVSEAVLPELRCRAKPGGPAVRAFERFDLRA